MADRSVQEQVAKNAAKLPGVGSVEGLSNLIQRIRSNHKAYERLQEKLVPETERFEALRDLLLRKFTAANAEVRGLIHERDAILTKRKLQASKRRDADVNTRRVSTGLADSQGNTDRNLNRLRGKVKALFGEDIPLADLETMSLRTRKLTVDETQLLGRVLIDAKRLRGAFGELKRQNKSLAGAQSAAIGQFNKFAGIDLGFASRIGPSGGVQGKLQKAGKEFAKYANALEQQRTHIEKTIRAIRSIEVAAGKAGRSRDVSGMLGTIEMYGSLAVLGGLVAAFSTPVLSVFGGVLVALGVFAKLIAVVGKFIEGFGK